MSKRRRPRGFLLFGFVALIANATASFAQAQVHVDIDLEEPPFAYLDTKDDNRVTRLLEKIQSKEIKLEYSREHGYLRSYLAALDIPESSQTLVLSPYSDIVALMVLEHQSQMHNVMTRADFTVRQLQYDNAQLEKTAESAEEWKAQLRLIAEDVVDYMLFCDETPLTSEVKGTRAFRDQFTARGPKDSQGRSLRDFDMKTRMFKYPCSYLIYSSAFDNLNEQLRHEVILQLGDVLEGRNASPKYDHLTPTMRREILEILRETMPAFRL